MSSAYRSSLVLLVFLNVVFIHITGAVSLQWLLPLYALTLTAVVTKGLRDNKIYRSVWDTGVLAIFALLVVDATSSGITHLLEDGLMLAVFCQVHLLNVLQKKQKPDLLFFNSFLIALVTSFFSQDLIYSMTFLVYSLVFLLALQLNNLSDDRFEIPSKVASAVIHDGARRAVIILSTTCVVFLFWPRDFHREGLVQERIRWNRHDSTGVGFDEEVRLGRSARTTLSDRVVMKIHLLEGDIRDIPSHWRGATLSMQSRDRWYAGPALSYQQLDEHWIPNHRGWQRSGTTQARVRVEFLKPTVRRLFNPLDSNAIIVHPPANADLAVPQFDGTIRFSGINIHDEITPPLRYEVSIPKINSTAAHIAPPRQLAQYRGQNPGMVTPEAQERLRAALAGLDDDPRQAKIVENCRTHLATQLDYLLPGTQGAAANLQEFMSGEAGGHCEYFASALAVMLRMRDIPCRMVTGYLAQDWDDDYRTLIVRDKHAHAWLEVYEPGKGWYTVDPSPTAAGDEFAAISDWYGPYLSSIQSWWASVTQFDESSRGAAMQWFAALPSMVLAEVRHHPLRFSGWVAAIIMLLFLRKRLQPRLAGELRAYQRTLRRVGLARAVNETPRELLARAQTQELRTDHLELLASATAEHETQRYQS